MTPFIDVRAQAVGGGLAASIGINEGTNIADYRGLDLSELLNLIRGAHVLIGTHGFNVPRADAVASLSNWASLLTLDAPAIFVGLLWPGDSVWAHGIDYPDEPRVADSAGEMVASFVDEFFGDTASVSFSSHSLGARVILEAISQLNRPVRRAILMAGAIDDNCLCTGREFEAAASNVEEISLLASKKDEVLEFLYPAGNFAGGILTAGHPWWRSALGRSGAAKPQPSNFRLPYLVPDNWNFGHGSYLEVDTPAPAPITVSTDVPQNGAPYPASGVKGWQEAWSAAFASTRFR